ncbi:hypothetical protein [Streptomyces sp. NPDC056883]|uniref:hypothetical protein n=1 Tax=Streptomyces sp. NPDC056883 TaxID=3345959 RepID=UPI0036C3B028
MGSKENVIRFRAVSNDGRCSTAWRIWAAAEEKSDVYLLSGPSGGIAKVSLHESGIWRIAYSNPTVAERYLEPGEDRLFDSFPIPLAEVAPGWTEAFTVVLPDSELLGYGPPKKKSPTVDLPSPGKDQAVCVTVLLGKPGSTPYQLTQNQTEVGSFTLPDGRNVHVVSEPTGLPAHYVEAIEQVRKQTCETVLGLGLDLAEQAPSQVLLFGDPDGSRLAVEVSAWTLDGQPR